MKISDIVQLCKNGAEPFDDDRYIFENKLDGVRAIYVKLPESSARILNRHDRDITDRFPEIKFDEDGKGVIVDGEIVCLDSDGLPDFKWIMGRSMLDDKFKRSMRIAEHPATFVVFDVIMYDGVDLRDLPLMERKKYLSHIKGQNVRYVEYSDGKGKELFDWVKKNKLEGIIAKRKDAPYIAGRNNWLKIKNWKEGIFKISRFEKTVGEKGNDGFVIYVSLENGGEQRVAVAGHDDRLEIEQRVANGEELCAEVQFLELTSNGRLRKGTFKRLATMSAKNEGVGSDE